MTEYHNHVLYRIVFDILQALLKRLTPGNYSTIRQIFLLKINEEIQKESIREAKEVLPRKRKIEETYNESP